KETYNAKKVSAPEQQTNVMVALQAWEVCYEMTKGSVEVRLSNHWLRKPGEDNSPSESLSVCIGLPPNWSKQQLLSYLEQLIRYVQANDLPARIRSLRQREAGMTLMREAFGKVATARDEINDAMKLLGLDSDFVL